MKTMHEGDERILVGVRCGCIALLFCIYQPIDDDSVVCIRNVVRTLRSRATPSSRLLWGRFWCGDGAVATCSSERTAVRADESFLLLSNDVVRLVVSAIDMNLLRFDGRKTFAMNLGYWSWFLKLNVIDDSRRFDSQQGYLTEYMHLPWFNAPSMRTSLPKKDDLMRFCRKFIFAHHALRSTIAVAKEAATISQEQWDAVADVTRGMRAAFAAINGASSSAPLEFRRLQFNAPRGNDDIARLSRAIMSTKSNDNDNAKDHDDDDDDRALVINDGSYDPSARSFSSVSSADACDESLFFVGTRQREEQRRRRDCVRAPLLPSPVDYGACNAQLGDARVSQYFDTWPRISLPPNDHARPSISMNSLSPHGRAASVVWAAGVYANDRMRRRFADVLYDHVGCKQQQLATTRDSSGGDATATAAAAAAAAASRRSISLLSSDSIGRSESSLRFCPLLRGIFSPTTFVPIVDQTPRRSVIALVVDPVIRVVRLWRESRRRRRRRLPPPIGVDWPLHRNILHMNVVEFAAHPSMRNAQTRVFAGESGAASGKVVDKIKLGETDVVGDAFVLSGVGGVGGRKEDQHWARRMRLTSMIGGEGGGEETDRWERARSNLARLSFVGLLDSSSLARLSLRLLRYYFPPRQPNGAYVLEDPEKVEAAARERGDGDEVGDEDVDGLFGWSDVDDVLEDDGGGNSAFVKPRRYVDEALSRSIPSIPTNDEVNRFNRAAAVGSDAQPSQPLVVDEVNGGGEEDGEGGDDDEELADDGGEEQQQQQQQDANEEEEEAAAATAAGVGRKLLSLPETPKRNGDFMGSFRIRPQKEALGVDDFEALRDRLSLFQDEVDEQQEVTRRNNDAASTNSRHLGTRHRHLDYVSEVDKLLIALFNREDLKLCANVARRLERDAARAGLRRWHEVVDDRSGIYHHVRARTYSDSFDLSLQRVLELVTNRASNRSAGGGVSIAAPFAIDAARDYRQSVQLLTSIRNISSINLPVLGQRSGRRNDNRLWISVVDEDDLGGKEEQRKQEVHVDEEEEEAAAAEDEDEGEKGEKVKNNNDDSSLDEIDTLAPLSASTSLCGSLQNTVLMTAASHHHIPLLRNLLCSIRFLGSSGASFTSMSLVIVALDVETMRLCYMHGLTCIPVWKFVGAEYLKRAEFVYRHPDEADAQEDEEEDNENYGGEGNTSSLNSDETKRNGKEKRNESVEAVNVEVDTTFLDKDRLGWVRDVSKVSGVSLDVDWIAVAVVRLMLLRRQSVIWTAPDAVWVRDVVSLVMSHVHSHDLLLAQGRRQATSEPKIEYRARLGIFYAKACVRGVRELFESAYRSLQSSPAYNASVVHASLIFAQRLRSSVYHRRGSYKALVEAHQHPTSTILFGNTSPLDVYNYTVLVTQRHRPFVYGLFNAKQVLSGASFVPTTMTFAARPGDWVGNDRVEQVDWLRRHRYWYAPRTLESLSSLNLERSCTRRPRTAANIEDYYVDLTWAKKVVWRLSRNDGGAKLASDEAAAAAKAPALLRPFNQSNLCNLQRRMKSLSATLRRSILVSRHGLMLREEYEYQKDKSRLSTSLERAAATGGASVRNPALARFLQQTAFRLAPPPLAGADSDDAVVPHANLLLAAAGGGLQYVSSLLEAATGYATGPLLCGSNVTRTCARIPSSSNFGSGGDFREYLQTMVRKGTLALTTEAREFAPYARGCVAPTSSSRYCSLYHLASVAVVARHPVDAAYEALVEADPSALRAPGDEEDINPSSSQLRIMLEAVYAYRALINDVVAVASAPNVAFNVTFLKYEDARRQPRVYARRLSSFFGYEMDVGGDEDDDDDDEGEEEEEEEEEEEGENKGDVEWQRLKTIGVHRFDSQSRFARSLNLHGGDAAANEDNEARRLVIAKNRARLRLCVRGTELAIESKQTPLPPRLYLPAWTRCTIWRAFVYGKDDWRHELETGGGAFGGSGLYSFENVKRDRAGDSAAESIEEFVELLQYTEPSC